MNKNTFLMMSMIAFVPTASYSGERPSVLERAEGVWELFAGDNRRRGNFTCRQKPLNISIDIENMRYTASRDNHIDTADILIVHEKYFWIQYDNETRMKENGQPVRWAFVFSSENLFYWIRDDWEKDQKTTLRMRCRLHSEF